MMIQLVRNKIKQAFSPTDGINPSLLLQKGMTEVEDTPSTTGEGKSEPKKTQHLDEVAKPRASREYIQAFNRWFALSSDEQRFQRFAMTLENRLLIALSGNGALETGCSLSRNYGMPYLPGSSVKGVARAWVHQHLAAQSHALEALFGTAESEQPHRVSGLVTFHDAWWIPQEAAEPFVREVVTTHHPDYYNGSQEGEPSDKDKPIPNALLAVQGSFLFVLEGEPEALKLCQTILEKALATNGIGAKTAAGYGYMTKNHDLLGKLQKKNLEAIQQKEESLLSVEEKLLRSLREQLDWQRNNNIQNVSGQFREELKGALEQATIWNQKDIEQLQEIIEQCIMYWDPKRKNKKLKELRKEAESLTRIDD